MNAKALRVHGLTRHYGGVKAVCDVSFSVEAGESVALIGPNGAGKTTLIQLIGGVARADLGSIWLGERNISRSSPDQIACLGLARTFQTSRVFPDLSVMESVLIGGHPDFIGSRNGGIPLAMWQELAGAMFRLTRWRDRELALRERAENILRLFGDRLWSRRLDRAGSLSYANRRRLEIARALLAAPRVLLLDEPAAGMNPTETAELADLLLELRKSCPDMALIIVEHKLSFIRHTTERALAMVGGQLLMDGDVDAVLSSKALETAYLGLPPAPDGSGERR